MNTHRLTDLLRMLNGTRKNWVVAIESPEIDGTDMESWQGQLFLVDGKITCRVWRKEDKHLLFIDGEAIQRHTAGWLMAYPVSHEKG